MVRCERSDIYQMGQMRLCSFLKAQSRCMVTLIWGGPACSYHQITHTPNRAYLAGRGLEGTAQRHVIIPLCPDLHRCCVVWICNSGSHTSRFTRPYRANQDMNASSAFQTHYAFIHTLPRHLVHRKKKIMSLCIFGWLDDWGSHTKDPQHWLHVIHAQEA